jgi:hypothetical protein
VKRNGSWISLIGSCALMALAAALAFAIMVAAGSVALASHQSSDHQSSSEESNATLPISPKTSAGTGFSGMITDSNCGARHIRNSHLSPAECARACVRKGASYVLVDGDHRYTLIGGEDALERLAGERVKVSGTRQGDTILVSSTAPLF